MLRKLPVNAPRPGLKERWLGSAGFETGKGEGECELNWVSVSAPNSIDRLSSLSPWNR